MLRFLVDESTGINVSEKLKQMGFDSVSVIEIMRGAEDIDVIKRAKKTNRIIVTNDKDFGWLATIYKPPGLILLRLKKRNHRKEDWSNTQHHKQTSKLHLRQYNNRDGKED